MLIEERSTMTTPIRNKLWRKAASTQKPIEKLLSFLIYMYTYLFIMFIYIFILTEKKMFFSHFDYIENYICPPKNRILRTCAPLLYSFSHGAIYLFHIWQHWEEDEDALSWCAKKFVAKLDALGFSLFLFFVLLVYCSLFDCIILVPGIAQV